MTPNAQLIPAVVAKADMAMSQLVAGSGLLVAEQAQKFLRVAIKKSIFMQMVRNATMKNPTSEIPKLTTMGRVMHPAVEATALALAQRSRPGFAGVTLTSYTGKAEIHWPRQVLEDQVERAGFDSTIVSYMGEHVSADIEDLLILGDTASADDWLALTDGLLKISASNVYPAGSVTLSKTVLKNLILTRPEQFDEQGSDAFYTNRKARADYVDSLADRATTLGDVIIEGKAGKEIGYAGIPLRNIPRFPSTLAPGGTSTNVWYGNSKGVILAFGRKITLDREFRPSPQVYVVVITFRLAVGMEHEPTCAKATQVTGS